MEAGDSILYGHEGPIDLVERLLKILGARHRALLSRRSGMEPEFGAEEVRSQLSGVKSDTPSCARLRSQWLGL